MDIGPTTHTSLPYRPTAAWDDLYFVMAVSVTLKKCPPSQTKHGYFGRCRRASLLLLLQSENETFCDNYPAVVCRYDSVRDNHPHNLGQHLFFDRKTVVLNWVLQCFVDGGLIMHVGPNCKV